MFHVSTMLPHEESDAQKLQKKRHIGNDIVCVAFLESDDALFWPGLFPPHLLHLLIDKIDCLGCIKSHFLHTFIVVKTSPQPVEEGQSRKYSVAVVCRDEVAAFKPYLWHQSEFEKVKQTDLVFTSGTHLSFVECTLPRMATDQDNQRREGQLFGTEICSYAGTVSLFTV